MTDESNEARARFAYLALCGCMLVSGIAGLVYQLVWSRYLALFVGSSGRAQIIILATFMGGLGLGSYIFGRRADAIRSPLRLYGLLEVGIAVLGILYPIMFEPTRALFIAIVRNLGLGATGLDVAAITTCALTVLLPTVLMGGTLPVLGKYLIRSERLIGKRIATLYYINSFGAVIGAVITGFFLLRIAGLQGTILIAAMLNLLAAGCAFAVFATVGDDDDRIEKGSNNTELNQPMARGPISAGTIAIITIGISGAVAFFLEIAWVRMLTLVLGSASNSFALMLAAFIAGITLGSFFLSFKKSDVGYFSILGWSLLGVGLSTLITLFGYERLPLVLNHWRMSFANDEQAYGAFSFVSFLICFAVMVIPTIFMGMTLPAASRVYAQSLQTVGRRVGSVFAVNTFGSLLGAAIGGFVLLPAIGIRHLIELAVVVDVMLGLWIIVADRERRQSRCVTWRTAVVSTVIVGALYLVGAPKWDMRVFLSAPYRFRERVENLSALRNSLSHFDTPYYRDGKDATIAVIQERDTPPGAREKKTLLINGKPDASTGGDMYTQMMIGHFPMMLHAHPDNVLVVGFGSGVTIGAVSLYQPKIAECVELIPEVLEAGSQFAKYNHDVLNNPKVQIILQDAKTHLQISPHHYDVIISEPTNPWIAGVAGLFSQEFLETARGKMKPGGVFVQWFHTYEIKNESIFSILNTFNSVFPYSTLFNQSETDLAIIGSVTPFDPDFARMERVLARPDVAADLAQFGVAGVLPILSMQMVAKNRTPAPYLQIGGINSDFHPQLEYDAQVGFFIGKSARLVSQLDRRRTVPLHSGLWINSYKPSETPSDESFAKYFEVLHKGSGLDKHSSLAWCDLWETYHPESVALKMARVRATHQQEQAALQLLADPILADNDDALVARMKLLFRVYYDSRSWAKRPDADRLKQTCLRVIERRLPNATFAMEILGVVERDSGNFKVAEEWLIQGLADPKLDKDSRSRVLLRLAEAYIDERRFEEASAILEKIPQPEEFNQAAFEAGILKCRVAQVEQAK